MKSQLKSLTGLRAIAALWVFFYHAGFLAGASDNAAYAPLLLLGSAGYLGVDVFFVLSGFVIAYNYATHDFFHSRRAYPHFLWKRLARIYPAHLAALALFVTSLLVYVPPDADLSGVGLFRQLTMTDAWEIPAESVWNPVAWSISCEWAAYLAFPLLALATQRFKPIHCLIGIGVLFAGLYLALRLLPGGEGYHSMGLLRIATGFSAGVLVYRFWSAHRISINVATMFGLCVLIFGLNVYDWQLGRHDLVSSAPMIACVIVYGLASATGWLDRLLGRLEHAGEISYSFYLVHLTVIGLVQAGMGMLGFDHDPMTVYTIAFVSLLVSVVLAELSFRYVEQPARSWMRRIGEPQPSEPARSRGRLREAHRH